MARIKLWIVGGIISVILIWYLWSFFGLKLTIPIAIGLYLVFMYLLFPKAKEKVKEALEA